MNNLDMTIEEYIQYETKKAFRNDQVYNWETTMYGKINYFGDIDYLRFFKTKFLAIVYDDVLSSQHVDEVSWKNETSLFEYDDGKYNAISKNVLGIDKDQISYDIYSIDNLKLDKDDDRGLNTTYPETWIRRIDPPVELSFLFSYSNRRFIPRYYSVIFLILEQRSTDHDLRRWWSEKLHIAMGM
nr:hypothetical protein [Tanacetum cinerariifolium]